MKLKTMLKKSFQPNLWLQKITRLIHQSKRNKRIKTLHRMLLENFKISSINYALAVFALFVFAQPLMGQISNPQPLDAYEMGELVAQKMLDDRVENVVPELSDVELWSTIISTDSLLEIVYQPADFVGDILEDDVIFDIKSQDFIDAKNIVLDIVGQNNSQTTTGNILMYEDDEAPIIILRVDSYESIYELRNSRYVQQMTFAGVMNEMYVEDFRRGVNSLPARNEAFLRGIWTIPLSLELIEFITNLVGLGCGEEDSVDPYINLDFDQFDPSIDQEEYKRVPWHYTEMDILKANRCVAGAGVKVALLDTGISENQERLNDQFNATFPDRNVAATKSVPSAFSKWDNCGHGTRMAGIIAGPKYDDAVRGVAYESDLHSIKSNFDALLLSFSSIGHLKKGMKVIRKEWQGTGGTKIISMSLGYLWYSARVAYSLKKLDEKGILMFAAIGTTPKSDFFDALGLKKFQVYPGKSKRTVGVTGVYRNFNNEKEICDLCHYGKKVDFVVPVQYGNSPGGDIRSHSLSLNGNLPVDAGASSVATATMAGIAALVWGLPQNENKSDEEILDILIAASTYPNGKVDDFGHGMVDVAVATGCTAPDPVVALLLEDAQMTPRTNFTICEDIFLNAAGGIYTYDGHFLRLKSVVDGEPTTTLVETAWTPPYPGTLPLLNLTTILESEEENFTFTPGQTYEITFGVKDLMMGWHYAKEQFTIQLPPIEPVLPFAGSHSFNYGLENQSYVTNMDINDGGTLRVNDLGAVGYRPGTGSDSPMPTYYAEVRAYCGVSSLVTVHDGGRFILGNDSSGDGNRKAIVNVRAGNTVHVKAGGTLRLARGSQLIIDNGAKLIIEEGALIDLWWSDSRIRVNGEFELQGEFEFTGSGFFQFDPDHTLTLTSQFKLEGQSIDHRFLRISDGTTLDINNHYLNLKSGTIEYGHGAKIRIGAGGKLSAFLNVFTSTQAPNQTTGIGLLLDNPDDVNIQFSRFENLFYGIEIIGLVDINTFDVDYVWFNNNLIGIIGHSTDNVTIRNSFFDAKNDGLRGIELRNITNVNIQGNTFSNYPLSYFGALYLKDIDNVQVNSSTFTDNQNSIYLSNVYNFEMNGGWITNSLGYSTENTIGIRVPILSQQENVTNLYLGSNAQIKYQGIGIEVEKGGLLNNSTEVYGKVKLDCARLINNKRSIKGEDVTLEIDALVNCNCTDISEAKPNTFIRSAYANAGEKHFEICYDQLSVSEIPADGNFWSDGTSTNGIMIKDCSTQSINVPLIRDINVDSEPSGCSSGGNEPPTPQDDGKDRGEASTDSKDSAVDTDAISIHPNPTNGQFSILLSAGEFTVRIYDMSGKEVFNQSSMTANRQINAKGWTKGLYIVEAVEQSTKVQSYAKLLIQ